MLSQESLLEKLSEADRRDAGPQELGMADPVLGPALLRAGPKTLHLTPTSHLSSLPIWSRQRAFRPQRALEIAKSKLDSRVPLPGAIALCRVEGGGLHVVDGQHRVAALAILERWQSEEGADYVKEGRLAFDPTNCVTEVYDATEEEASRIFFEINKAEVRVTLRTKVTGGVRHRRRAPLTQRLCSFALRAVAARAAHRHAVV